MKHLASILWRNQGQVLTPELILGLLQGVAMAQEAPVPPAENYIDLSGFGQEEYKGFVFGAERFVDAVRELTPLHVDQWAEVDERLAVLPFRPNYDAYADLDRAGRIVQFTIRKDGELVGYCMVNVFESLHTRTMSAVEDSFYMAPAHRGGFTMIRFVKYMVRCLESIGIHEIRVTSKVSNKSYLLMERAGFKQCAIQLVMMTEKANEIQTQV